MTTVTFLTEGKRIIGFDAKGHSGYSEEGSDIVCAAVTSAVRLVESTVNDVLGLAASVKVHERSGAVEFRLPGGLSATNESTCQALLTGLMLLFSELHSEYPDNIEVMEAEAPCSDHLTERMANHHAEHRSSVFRPQEGRRLHEERPRL